MGSISEMDLYTGNFLSKYGKLHIKLIIVKCLFYQCQIVLGNTKRSKNKGQVRERTTLKRESGCGLGVTKGFSFFLNPHPTCANTTQ